MVTRFHRSIARSRSVDPPGPGPNDQTFGANAAMYLKHAPCLPA
jgi:hypothetical protein